MHRLVLVVVLGASCVASPSTASVTPSVGSRPAGAAQQTAMSEPPRDESAMQRSSPSPTASPSATPEPAVPPCHAAQLEALAGGQGATGSILGALFFANRGGSFRGLLCYPAVLLL